MAINQNKIHRLSLSSNTDDKIEAIYSLDFNFGSLPNKSVAWEDLHRLTYDKDSFIREIAVDALGSVFQYIPYEYISNALDDLYRVICDDEVKVRIKAVNALTFVYRHVSDRSVVWNSLILLTSDDEVEVRTEAVTALVSIYEYVPDKYDAWCDLVNIITNKCPEVSSKVSKFLNNTFEYIPTEFRNAAWNDLHTLTSDENPYVRMTAINLMVNTFRHVPDKFAAWDVLHCFITDQDSYIRQSTAIGFGFIFEYIPTEFRNTAWNDLHRLISDENSDVRHGAAFSFGFAFEYAPDKYAAWIDLHNLTEDKYSLPGSAYSFRFAFPFIPNEFIYTAWSDLHRLTTDEHSDVRHYAAYSLGFSFEYIPEKTAAWDDLHRLTEDEKLEVRQSAAYALGSAFKYIPDESKPTALLDLHRLAEDESDGVKEYATRSLGCAYPFVSNKLKSSVWKDLERMAKRQVPGIMMYANHSLGKICIYKASKSKGKSSELLLGEAIQYFEIASLMKRYYNPATFCYLFYCSFDAILFKKIYSKEKIEYYVSAAKKECRQSKNKRKLVEAIEQLAVILEKTNNTTQSEVDLQEMIIQCSDICNKVEILMKENSDKAPSMYELYEKTFPSFKSTIKKRIEEIKENVNILYIRAKPEFKDVALTIKQESDSILSGDYQYIDTLNLKLNGLLNNLHGGILSNPILSEKSKNEISLKIVNALKSDNVIQKADVVDESIKILLQKTSDNLREKIIKSIGVGGVFMSAVVLITPKNPIVAIIFGLIITFFTYYFI